MGTQAGKMCPFVSAQKGKRVLVLQRTVQPEVFLDGSISPQGWAGGPWLSPSSPHPPCPLALG